MDPQALIDTLKQAYEKAGILGLMAAALMLAVRGYKTDLVQSFLPEKVRWDNLSLWPQRGFVFGSSLLGSALVAVLGGLSWPVALAGALPVALGAMVAHKVTVVAGAALDGVSVTINPNYVPGTVRKLIGVVLPVAKPPEGTP